MHVLYLHQYFVPPDGSGGTRSYEMGRRMVAAGHQVTLVTSSAAFPPAYDFPHLRNTLRIDGIDLVVLRIGYSNRMSYAMRMLAFLGFAICALSEVVRVQKPDVVFASSTPLTIIVPALMAKLVHRCPMVFEVRDLWPEVPIAMGALNNSLVIRAARWLERLAYRHAARIVALSPGMADGIAACNVPGEKISVVPNSSDVDLFRAPSNVGDRFRRQHPYLDDAPLIVYTGALGRVNGVDYMTRIAEEMLSLQPAVRFLIAGWGSERDSIEAEARRRGVLHNNLWILPTLPKVEMPGLLSAATLASSFVINRSELWNNSANKFFDALAAGRPVMINHEGWQADFLRKSGAGLVIPPEDAKAAAKQICAFLDDPERLELARLAACKASETTFNRDRLASKLIATLEDVVELR